LLLEEVRILGFEIEDIIAPDKVGVADFSEAGSIFVSTEVS